MTEIIHCHSKETLAYVRQKKKSMCSLSRLRGFFKILKYVCYFSYLLPNFVFENVVMKIIVDKSLIIIHHIAHTFFKLGVLVDLESPRG